MTTQTTTSRPSFLARIGRALLNATEAVAAAQGRSNLYRELNAMSDAQLEEIGVRREDIARHVFRDIISI